MSHELQFTVFGILHVDCAGVLGVIKGQGTAISRHILIGQFWMREKEENDELKFHKVEGEPS